jgi:hypothetical protein
MMFGRYEASAAVGCDMFKKCENSAKATDELIHRTSDVKHGRRRRKTPRTQELRSNQNDIREEIKNRLNSGNACYHSV